MFAAYNLVSRKKRKKEQKKRGRGRTPTITTPKPTTTITTTRLLSVAAPFPAQVRGPDQPQARAEYLFPTNPAHLPLPPQSDVIHSRDGLPERPRHQAEDPQQPLRQSLP